MHDFGIWKERLVICDCYQTPPICILYQVLCAANYYPTFILISYLIYSRLPHVILLSHYFLRFLFPSLGCFAVSSGTHCYTFRPDFAVDFDTVDGDAVSRIEARTSSEP